MPVIKAIVRRVRRRRHPIGSEYTRYFKSKLDKEQALHRIDLSVAGSREKIAQYTKDQIDKTKLRIRELRVDYQVAYKKMKYWSKKSRKLDDEVAGLHAERYRKKVKSLDHALDMAKKKLEVMK